MDIDKEYEEYVNGRGKYASISATQTVDLDAAWEAYQKGGVEGLAKVVSPPAPDRDPLRDFLLGGPGEEGKSFVERRTGIPFSSALEPVAQKIRDVTRPMVTTVTEIPSNPLGIPDIPVPFVAAEKVKRQPISYDEYLKSPLTTAQTGVGEVAGNPLNVEAGMTTISPGVAANFILGMPTAAAATAGEMLAQEAEQAPDTATLMGIGRVNRLVGTFHQLGNLTEKVVPKLVYQGGMIPEAKTAFGRYETALIKSDTEAVDMAEKILTAGTERTLSKEERYFLDTLTQQPRVREAMMANNAEAFPVNLPALAEEIPSFKGMPNIEVPQTTLKPKQFAQVAQEVAEAHGKNLNDMAAILEKDPDQLSRLTELNYSPRMFADKERGAFPSVQRLIRERKGFLKAREEMSWEEWQRHPERVDPAEAHAMRFMQERRLTETRRLFNDMAINPEITRPPMNPLELELESGMKSADGLFVKMGQSDNLGPLSGMLVRKPEAEAIQAMTRQMSSGIRTWRHIYSSWKFAKTVLNPKTHINNFSSNAMLAHMAGLSPYRLDIYAEALNEMKKRKGLYWDEARQAGAPWMATFNGRLSSRLDDVLDIRAGQKARAESIYEAFAADFNRWATNNKASKYLAEQYQASEAYFKQAVFIKLRKEGVKVSDAIQRADEAIINYGHMPEWVKQLRSSPIGIPFVSFTYGAAPRVVQAMLERPDVFQHYRLFADSWNTLAAEAAQIDKNTLAEIYTAFPGTIPLIDPTRSADGKPIVYDVARKTPIVDFLPARFAPPTGYAIADMILGQGLRNPIANEIFAQATGVDPFFKSEFAKPLGYEGGMTDAGAALGMDPTMVQEMLAPIMEQAIGARGKRLARTALPELAGGGTTQNLINAIQGKQTFLGEANSPMRALVEGLVLGPSRSLDQAQMGAALQMLNLKKESRKAARKEAGKK